MCKELVRLTTNDVNNAITVVSSREVAENFNKRHSDVIRTIEAKLTNAKLRSLNYFIETNYTDAKGEIRKEYLLTRDGFSFIVMGFTGEKADEFKINYIKAFNLMENELKARQETRHIGVSIRKSLTDSIKENVNDEGNFKKFAYSNYTKLVYKKVLGMTVKKFKEEKGIKKEDNIRNYLDIKQLEKVQAIESKIAIYIETLKDMELTDKETYDKVKKMLDKQ